MINFYQWLNENFEENPYFWDKDSSGYREHEYKKFISLVDNFCKVVNKNIQLDGFRLYPYNYSDWKTKETGFNYDRIPNQNHVNVALELSVGTRYRFSVTQNSDGTWGIIGVLSAANLTQGLDRPIEYRELANIFLNIVRSIQDTGYEVVTAPDGQKYKQPSNGFNHNTNEITPKIFDPRKMK